MRWLLKALAQQAFSALPRSESVNYLFQRHVTRTLPLGDVGFRRKATRAIQHLAAFDAHGAVERGEATFYEFGAGWDLVIPLGFYSLGVERQILIDIRPNLRLDLVNASVAKYERLRPELEEEAGRSLRPLGPPTLAAASELERRFGITYLAPRDARDTGLPAASVDFVSSTDTFEHIPPDDLRRILGESRRLLKSGGLLSARIGLEDHYAYADRSISPYNFLKYGDRVWRLLNPPLQYQNRLRYPDYVRLLESSGFELVEQRVARPSERDVELVRGIALAPRFRNGYSPEELAVKGLIVVARPS